jgi:superfamily II DNA or RNA helicase
MKTKDEIQDECFKELVNHHRCSAALSMGTGKTLLGLKHMKHFHKEGNRYLVVAPKNSIFQSWKDDAVKFGMEELVPCITFTTYLSLTKHDWTRYNALYLDECHSLKEHMSLWLSQFGGRILGLTGTPPRSKFTEKGKMMDMFCPVVYRYSTDQAVEDNILNDYQIYIHLLPLNPNKTMLVKTKTGKSWTTSEQDSYYYYTRKIDQTFDQKTLQFLRIQRMRQMMNFETKELYAKKLFDSIDTKCLLFANTQDQADKLCKHSYHSMNPNSEENLEEFKSGKINKLSAVLQLSEGINIPNLKSCIILHSYSSNTKTAQRLGRALRLNPNDKSEVHILVYKNTIDEEWTKQALKEFDDSKIIWQNKSL